MNRPAHKTIPQRHAFSWSYFPSTFNGKEKDYESGFHHYGTRYYWSETLTGWLNVDPMLDKCSNISPYAYCNWNPIILIDPDGNEIRIYYKNKTGIARLFERQKYIVYSPNMNYSGNNSFVSETVQALNYMSQGDTKGIISKIANDQDNAVKIKKTKIGNDCYKPWSNTVNYNPQSGLATVDDEGNPTGGRQSPALGLLHELGHAFVDLYFPRKEKQALHTPDDRYDFKSER